MSAPALRSGVVLTTMLTGIAPAQGPYLIAETRDPTTIGGLPASWGLVVGDLNGDSLLDAAHIDGFGVSTFLNLGNGRSQVLRLAPGNPQTNCAALIDLDLDGDLDGVAVSSGADPMVVLNDGQGRFTLGSAATFFVTPGPHGGQIEAADFDRDGRDDLLIAGALYEQARLFLRPSSSRFVDVTSTHMPVLQTHLHDLACRDLDADGDIDIAAAVVNDYDRVLLNDGTGRFTAIPLIAPFGPHLSVALLDLNRDGLPDIFIGGYRSPSYLWLNMGGGNFFDARALVSHIASVGDASAGGDVDGDGWDDLLLVGEPLPDLQLHRNLAGQGLALVPNGVLFQVSIPTFAATRLYLHDMDNDGDLDAIAAAMSYLTPYRYWFIPNTTRHVETRPPVRIGGSFTANLWGYPGQFLLPMISLRGARFDLGTLGVLGLDPSVGVTLPPMLLAGRVASLSFPVPPGSAGARLYTQALVLDPRSPSLTRLTNWMDDTVVR